MRFGRTTAERYAPHVWFAWRPVQLNNGRYAWLEPVMRWRVKILWVSYWEYEAFEVNTEKYQNGEL